MESNIDPQVRAEVLKDFEDSLREAGDTRTSDILARERKKYEDMTLPKPGHVWWRFHSGEPWKQGMVIHGKREYVVDRYGNEIAIRNPVNGRRMEIGQDGEDVEDPGECLICGSRMSWGTTEMIVSVGGEATQQNVATPVCQKCGKWIPANGGTVRKEEMGDSAGPPPNPFKKSIPSYARRWEEMSASEQDQLRAILRAWAYDHPKHVYINIVRLASLPILRSAEGFTRDDLDEIQNVISNHRNDPYHKRTRAIAAKVQELERRSTS